MSVLGIAALIAAGAIVFFAIRARRRRAGADFPAAFVPHVAVELTLRRHAAAIQGRHSGVFAVGRTGFSVRFDAALQPGVPQRVDAQFLKPELALPYFVPGAAFSMVDGPRLIADGEVLRVLGQNEAHEPGQGRRTAL